MALTGLSRPFAAARGRPIIRRDVLRTAAAGAVAAAGWSAGCGPARKAAPPTAAATKTVVVFQAGGSFSYASAKQWPETRQLIDAALTPFRKSHPGIDLRVSDNRTPNLYLDVIAGTAPDLVQLNGGPGAIGAWVDRGLLVDLEPYIRQSNFDVEATFASSTLSVVSRGASVYAFPYYTETDALAVNEGVLDAIGAEYPSQSSWTHLEWADWARKVQAGLGSGAGKTPRFATTVAYVGGVEVVADFYLRGWGGGLADPTARTRCLLGSADSIACGQFLYPLVLEGVAQTSQINFTQFAAGTQVAPVIQQGFALTMASQMQGVKWSYYPMPRWPEGAYNFTNENLVGININTKAAEAAWEVLQWVCGGTEYQRTIMQMSLYPPATKALWSEWVSQVHALAPKMRGKNLEVFTSIMSENLLVPVYGDDFTYQSTQALDIISGFGTQITGHRLEVGPAFTQAAQQVNALEQAAAQRAPAVSAAAAQFPTVGPAIAAAPTGM